MRFSLNSSFLFEKTILASISKYTVPSLLRISFPKALLSLFFISGYFSYNPLAMLSTSRMITSSQVSSIKPATVLLPEDIFPVIPIILIIGPFFVE
jgi:hypothetical protein